jgi:long-chain acyl-CoA synthetase
LFSSIPEAFRARARETPESPAYLQHRDGAWQTLSWSDVRQRVARLQRAFAQSVLRPGDRVGIFMPNCVDWVVADLAALSQGLVTVPVYTRDSAANICHVMRDSGARFCVTDTAERWMSLGEERNKLPHLETVWTLEGSDSAEPRLVQCPEPSGDVEDDLPIAAKGPDSLATLIYTSGTTGPPKGVMLSHRALLWNASAVSEVNALKPDDLLFSVLPLAHAFERTLGYLNAMLGNAPMAFARSVEHLSEDMQTLRPSIMLAVPRLFDRARARVVDTAEKSAVSARLLKWTEDIGWQRRLVAEGKKARLSPIQRLFWMVAGQRIASRVRDAFGGRIRMMICGGAALSGETSRFMAAMGLPLLQGYGLTEAGPAVTGCKIKDRRSDSVGFALPGCELKIGEKRELLLRSPGVMLGYWNKPEATREVLDSDGWLHTGDVAEIVDGRVYIVGRIKDILVLSTGENVNPNPIETALLSDPLIEQACVLGDGRQWCSAVVVVNPPAFEQWKAKAGLSSADPEDPSARDALVKRLKGRMQHIPPFARVADLVIEETPWDLNSGLITPTLKAKRPRIAERYSEQLDKLYKSERRPAGK